MTEQDLAPQSSALRRQRKRWLAIAVGSFAVIGIAPAPDLVLETTTDRADRAITTTSRRDRSGI